MPNQVKELFAASTDLTITIASLASSSTGVGRQSTVVDNSADRFQKVILYAKITVGASPTNNRAIRFYLIRDDAHGTNHRTDGAGAVDAAITVKNAPCIGSIYVEATTSNIAYYGEFVIYDPGPGWAIAIVQDTAVALHATAGNHWIRFVGVNPEVQ